MYAWLIETVEQNKMSGIKSAQHNIQMLQDIKSKIMI